MSEWLGHARRRLGSRPLLASLLSFVVTAVLLLPYCDVIYRCGCRPPWFGADEFCNVRLAGPHCPWCEPRNHVAMTVAFLAIFIGQGMAIHYFHGKNNSSVGVLVTVGIAVFLILGALNGFIFKTIDSYPHFF